MAKRKWDEHNIEELKKRIDEFKLLKRPTLSGLSRLLEIHPDTLYRNTDREDGVGDILLDAYLWLVQQHEEALWDSKNYGAHIWWLKTLKKHITFNENHDPLMPEEIHFTYELVKKPIDITLQK